MAGTLPQSIRPYELSIWSLQDQPISVIKGIDVYNQGYITEPQLQLSVDGTENLSFSVPMYLRNGGQDLTENPAWYNVINGNLMVGMRKLRIFFNKGDEDEQVYDFIITKVEESHENGVLTCKVEAEGTPFQELGNLGYKINLSQDEFELDYQKWVDSDGKEGAELPNLQYWADKVLSVVKNWTYEVQMDWSDYDGNRANDKVYEDAYVSSWHLGDKELVAAALEKSREKARIVSVSNSNVYNATQTIAETFGIYCRYEYSYDENYHITGRKCVFYNKALNDRNPFDITYQYNTSSIQRTMDSTDLKTKLYVNPIEDSNSLNGEINIAQVDANKTREDYIFNFDYLREIGGITEDQYKEVPKYEQKLHLYNLQLEEISNSIAEKQILLTQISAEKVVAQNAVKEAQEQVDEAEAMLRAILGETGIFKRATTGTVVEREGKHIINLREEGAFVNDANPLKIYLSYSSQVGVGGGTPDITISGPDNSQLVYDATGNLDYIQLSASSYEKFKNADGTYKTRCYLYYSYCPDLYYRNIRDEYKGIAEDKQRIYEEKEKQEGKLQTDIATLQERYDSIKAEKQKAVYDFEGMMGPAIREGYWQADNYTDYGEYITTKLNSVGQVDGKASLVWDQEPFEGEQLSYYEVGASQTKHYYPYFTLSPDIAGLMMTHFDDLWVRYYTSRGGNDKIPHKIYVRAGLEYGYRADNNNLVLLLTRTDIDPQLLLAIGSEVCMGYTRDNEDHVIVSEAQTRASFTVSPSPYMLCYLRVKINSSFLKTNEDQLSLKYNTTAFKKYEDYSVLSRGGIYYITPKIASMLNVNPSLQTLTCHYVLSSGALSMYLDAKEVCRTNSMPQVSYEVKMDVCPRALMRVAYKNLGYVAHIHDNMLKFKNVLGYVNGITLNLDQPWNDEYEVKNYKTKFEDLFSRIVASSEQMKTNAIVYNKAASAFASNGTIKADNIQETLDMVDLKYAFNNGDLTITENDGIWATSDEGVIAIRGGGIFTANQKDEDGNWEWNTGIVPSGINASLIKSGQIDTTKIKIFAGKNVALQMNKDGYFAYRQIEQTDNEGNTNLVPTPDEFVTHNGDGLFLINRTEAGDELKLVEISWDGLKIRNKRNEVVLEANDAGNLVLNHIEAKSGRIGNMEIDAIDELVSLTLEPLEGTQFRYKNGEFQNTSLSFAITPRGFVKADDWEYRVYYRPPVEGSPYTNIPEMVKDENGENKPNGKWSISGTTLTLTNKIMTYENETTTRDIMYVKVSLVNGAEEEQYSAIVTLYITTDGSEPYILSVYSSKGTIFQEGPFTTTLSFEIRRGNKPITDLTSAVVAWIETRESGDQPVLGTGKTLVISNTNITKTTRILCHVNYDSVDLVDDITIAVIPTGNSVIYCFNTEPQGDSPLAAGTTLLYDCFTKEITGTLEEGWNFGWTHTTSNHSPLFISAAVVRPENPVVMVAPQQFSKTAAIGFYLTKMETNPETGVEEEVIDPQKDNRLTTEGTFVDAAAFYKKAETAPVVDYYTSEADISTNNGWYNFVPDYISGVDENKRVYVVYKVRAKFGEKTLTYLTEVVEFNWALYDAERMAYEKDLQVKTDYQDQINTINGNASSMTTQIQILATRTSRIYQDKNKNLIIYDNTGIGENESIDDFLKHTYYTQYSSDGLYIRYGDETISTFNASGTLMRRMEMDGATSPTVYLTQSARGGWVWKPKVEVNGNGG